MELLHCLQINFHHEITYWMCLCAEGFLSSELEESPQSSPDLKIYTSKVDPDVEALKVDFECPDTGIIAFHFCSLKQCCCLYHTACCIGSNPVNYSVIISD